MSKSVFESTHMLLDGYQAACDTLLCTMAEDLTILIEDEGVPPKEALDTVFTECANIFMEATKNLGNKFGNLYSLAEPLLMFVAMEYIRSALHDVAGIPMSSLTPDKPPKTILFTGPGGEA